jgi:5-formyltetrahydrofolate cyclo-ligase
VAFDRKNNRLGRGEGYYDRFLKLLPSTTPTIGLAFDFQLVDTLPELEAHDMPVSLVLTA